MDLPTLLSLCLVREHPLAPASLWTAWSVAPQTVLPLAAALVLYGFGLRARHRHGQPVSGAQRAGFVLGWLVLVLALVSPLCRLSATLVSAHMVQHVLIVAVAAPLLAWGEAGRVISGVFVARARHASGRPASALPLAVAYGAAIWAWHFPPLYALVLTDAAVHTLAYGVLIVVSVAFWSPVVQARPRDGFRAVPSLFFTLVHTGVLGALLTFSPRPWYPVLARGAEAWGWTPLEDQQLAGLIMWVPMAFIYLAAALMVFGRHLSTERPLRLRGSAS